MLVGYERGQRSLEFSVTRSFMKLFRLDLQLFSVTAWIYNLLVSHAIIK